MQKRLMFAALMMATGTGAAGAAGATGAASNGPAFPPAPTAPPASNPPSPTDTGAASAATADTAAAAGEGVFYVRNNMPRPVTLGGVLLVPGTVSAVPTGEKGVNKRDAEMDGLEIVSTKEATGGTAKGLRNELEVRDVLHPDNSGVTLYGSGDGGAGATLAKAPDEIVKDAKASGWKAPKQ